MSEVGLPETDAEVVEGDEQDGCELDFSVDTTSDDEIASYLAAPAAPMRERLEDEWERDEEKEEG